jgi:hypothetical protein
MKYQEIQELNQLSKEVFGSSSRWRKLVDRGVQELVEEDTTRLSPDGAKETVKTPKMYVGPNGGELPQSQLVRYTPETIKEKMLSLKAQREQFLEKIKKQQEEQKAAKEAAETARKAEEAVASASGSSV